MRIQAGCRERCASQRGSRSQRGSSRTRRAGGGGSGGDSVMEQTEFVWIVLVLVRSRHEVLPCDACGETRGESVTQRSMRAIAQDVTNGAVFVMGMDVVWSLVKQRDKIETDLTDEFRQGRDARR